MGKNMNYYISKDSTKIPVSQLAELLHKTYWAENRSVEAMEQSVRHSLCYGAYDPEDGKLIGFARVITDYATTYYLCDVVVEEAHRGKGIGKALLTEIVTDPRLCGLKALLLTRDAHGFYQRFGFREEPGRLMMKSNL